jgi:hypothetical protein
LLGAMSFFCMVCLGSFWSLRPFPFSVSIWLRHMKSWGGVGYVRRYPKYSRLTLLLTPYSMRS